MDSKILLKIQSKVNASKVFLCDAHYFMAKWWSSNDIKNKQNGYPVPQKRFNWIRHKKGKLDVARSTHKWTYHLSGHSCPLNVPPVQIYLLKIDLNLLYVQLHRLHTGLSDFQSINFLMPDRLAIEYELCPPSFIPKGTLQLP